MDGIQAGVWDAGARVHAAAVHSDVQATRAYREPGPMQAKVDPEAGKQLDRTSEAKSH